jgi:hypothetical protein
MEQSLNSRAEQTGFEQRQEVIVLTKKQPVFGILRRSGTVWAEIVDDVEADTL